MNNKKIASLLLVLPLVLAPPAQAEELSLQEAAQRLIDNYPDIRLGKLRMDRAQQGPVIADSQLGWQLFANAGASHDLTIYNVAADQTTAGLGVQKQFSGGGTVGLNGGYSHTDQISPLPGALDPLTYQTTDLSYRQPLRRGAGNPQYKHSINSARAGIQIARANHMAVLAGRMQQLIDTYHGAALTLARMENAKSGVARAERLKQFIINNSRLGLTERKDLLQAEAQVQALNAELKSVQTLWEIQRTGLNRLIGRPWDEEFTTRILTPSASLSVEPEQVINEALAISPERTRLQAQLKIAESALRLAKDQHKSKFDVVVSVGTRQGSAPGFDQNEVAGSAGIEFQRPLSKRGLDAALVQAKLDHDIMRDDLRRAEDDVRYQVRSLLAEISTIEASLAAYQSRLATEREKMSETRKRYRQGRADTSQLIQFENELHFAELAASQQQIELARKHLLLKLARGTLWQDLGLRNTGLAGTGEGEQQ